MKKSVSLVVTFIVIELAIFTSQNTLSSFSIDVMLLMYANLFFVTLSLISISMQMKAMNHKNPNVFIRSVMGSMLLKMLITVIGVIIYIQVSGQNFNKRGVFVSLFLYLIYLSVEVMTLMKLNKKTNG